ncbi:MAG: ATP-binding cassette domain-containing protein [Acholeplasmataceae bacterium]|nr:ATP-binding cassette domain-containing protein [Acholeplasmataceae bacterium]
MLELNNIKKDYFVAGKPFPALNGISLNFKKNEFVSILGASGSGKTTLLNIIGGLDRYSSGDLLVDGKSTKDFSDTNWDAYRNATIGFVFQNYNLISHLSVLDNVEMALRLSGVGAKERKERATTVLIEVGLKDHINKRPNQLSGGQMQRVAIARALVNNPMVLLADEPSGALDSHTSHQILELIQKISKDRLVIMVTHNSELANSFSDRIVTLVDGRVVEDTRPVKINSTQVENDKLLTKKTSMSYMTALKTSFKNLLTKKGRTLITALAGSIGIIGIALVLSISSGMTRYVNDLQSDTLAGFPISVNAQVATDIFSGATGRYNAEGETNEFPDTPTIYPYDQAYNTTLHTNVIDDSFINYLEGMDSTFYNSISYTRAVQLNLIAETSTGGYIKVISSVNPNSLFIGGSVLSEIPNNPEFIKSQYDILSGSYPESYDQVVLIVDKENLIDVSILEKLGISVTDSYSFDDFIGMTFKTVSNDDYFSKIGNIYIPQTDYETMFNSPDATAITIVGIMRVNENASTELLSTGIGYTTMLTDYIIESASTSGIVNDQIASPDINILTGLPFTTTITYQNVMRFIGGDSTPIGVQIYPISFDAKDQIKEYIDTYNIDKTEEQTILYTDLAETISNTISSLIGTITIILSAFAGISLVVSSVMIGIITYVSVVERTKEIGIMRSLGARKKDISRIFNAETILIGLVAGIFGILLAMLLNIPVNIIINRLIGVPGFSSLELMSAAGLVALSTVLTLIAGLIPSGIAARRDPVVALRTE